MATSAEIACPTCAKASVDTPSPGPDGGPQDSSAASCEAKLEEGEGHQLAPYAATQSPVSVATASDDLQQVSVDDNCPGREHRADSKGGEGDGGAATRESDINTGNIAGLMVMELY